MTIAEGAKKTAKVSHYDHSKYELRRKFLRFLIRSIGLTLLAKVDSFEGQENLPDSGPAILMINHIAFIDPIVMLPFLKRNIVPMAKIEVYDYPVIGIFPHIWGVIPVRREEVDRRAIQQSLEVLRSGEIILVAPEGTRGPELKQGKEGVAYLASRSGAPILPTAIIGTRGFPALRGTRRWRGPGAKFQIGRPFRFRSEYRHAGRDQLRQMTDEAMYVLAAMLPGEQRGYYRNLSAITQETIEFL
jgi:1-acyl-sn-glycerol-3-phosphate acyltransferase